jgi:hypothetical protein
MNRPADGWQQTFDEPLELPDGRKLRTLADAIAWMAKEIPKSERGMKQVQAARIASLKQRRIGGPMIFARTGMMQAINGTWSRNLPQETTHWGKRKLKRDE